MDFNPNISLFKSAKSNMPYNEFGISIEVLLGFIKNGTYKSKVEAVRACENKSLRSELKKQLEAVTFSGLFSKRNANSLIKYSGIICHDVDNLEENELQKLKKELSECVFVYAVFISPSGNGLKVLFRTETDASQHLEAWTSIGNYLKEYFGIIPDVSCKDICRLCFVSYDEELFINEDSAIITNDFVTINSNDFIEEFKNDTSEKLLEEKPVIEKTYNVSASLEERFLQICHDTAIKKSPNVRGNYNKYVTTFALFANRYDLDEAVVFNYLLGTTGDHDQKDTKDSIASTYRTRADERGIWKDDFKGNAVAKPTQTEPKKEEKKADPYPKAKRNDGKVNDEVKFWFSVNKKDPKGKNIIDEETGEVKVDYKLSFDNAMDFLQNNGFYKLYEGESYRLIRIEKDKNQVDVVLDIRLEEFMLDYLKSQRNEEFNRVREIFRQSVTKFCNTRQFAGLDYYTPVMRKDTATTAYVYFKNCYFEISKDGAKQSDYSKMDGFIWKKQLINHDYTPVDFNGCDFQLFILLAITGKRTLQELDEVERKKYDATITGMGYLLHKYKNPSMAKAVLGVDKKTRANNEEMNGGSGKSIIGRAIGKMLNMFLIDGQNFRFDDQFAFDGVSPDTQFINFNDVNGSFNFQRMFGMITEDFTYRGLYAKRVSVPYEDSPKFYISTNHTLRGDGESVLRRQHIIEFTDYFNSRHTPLKELGRMMFSGWDAIEWSRFYSFFMHCISTFLEVGLVDFPIENYGLRKLLEWNKGAGSELNDYLNETIKEQLDYNKVFEKKKLFDGFTAATSADLKFVKLNSFSAQVNLWAKINKLEINAHLNGERDRRNSIDWLTFTPIPGEHNERDVFDEAIESRERLGLV